MLFCHVAFTELQTEIPDFTSDVGQATVPFFDYRSYTFKLLFPHQKLDHPILHMPHANVRISLAHWLLQTTNVPFFSRHVDDIAAFIYLVFIYLFIYFYLHNTI